ncbi:MAG: hypothetical protein ACRYG4_28230, partial [Janthinobacterium lividum]
MHDIKAIRADPAAFDAALARKGMEPQSNQLVALDATYRADQTAAQENLAERNRLSKEIGQAMARKDSVEAARLLDEVQSLKDQ